MKKIKINTAALVPRVLIDNIAVWTNPTNNRGDGNYIMLREEGGSALTDELNTVREFNYGDVVITTSGQMRNITIKTISHCCLIESPELERDLRLCLKTLFKDWQFYKKMYFRTNVILWPAVNIVHNKEKNNNIIASIIADELVLYQQRYERLIPRAVYIVGDADQMQTLNKYLRYRNHWLLKHFKLLWR